MASFDAPAFARNRMTITFQLAGSALVMSAPKVGIVPIEGTLAIGGRAVVRDQPNTAPGTVKEVVLDLTKGPQAGPDVVDVTFPPGAPATSAGLQSIGISPSPQLLQLLEGLIEQNARDAVKANLPAFSLTPGGIALATPPAAPFSPTQVDVRVIDDRTGADRDALSTLVRTCRGPEPTLDPDLVTSSAVPAGADAAVVIDNWVLLSCLVCPSLLAALPEVTRGDLDPAEPCKLATSVGIARQGQPSFVLTALEATVRGSQIVVTGAIRKTTVTYRVDATFEIDVDLRLQRPPLTPGVLAVITTQPVQTSVYIEPWVWIAAAAVLAFLFPAIIAFVVIVVAAISAALAGGPLSNAITRGLQDAVGTFRAIPLGPLAAGFTPTSLSLDDLLLGGSVQLPLTPPPGPGMAVVDSARRPLDVVQVTPQLEGSSTSFQLYVHNRTNAVRNITKVAVVDDPAGAVKVAHGVTLPFSVPPGLRGLPGRFEPPAQGLYLPLVTLSTDDPTAPTLEVDVEARALPGPPSGRLTVAPTSLNFGQLLLQAPAGRTLTLTNVGNAPADITALTLASETPAGQFVLPWSWPTPIPQGQSRTLPVGCTPTTTGAVSAQLIIDVQGSTVSTQRLVVPLQAQVGAPVIVVDPALLNFGAPPPGASATRTFVVRNEGDMTLEVQALYRTLGVPNFIPDPAVTFPLVLAPGASRSIDVTWTAGPTPGAVDVNEFSFASNDPLTPNASLRCVGATAGPRIVVTPDFVEFGAPPTVPATRTVTIENGGSTDLTVTSVRRPKAPFSLAGVPTTPFAVPSGGQTAFTAEFAPAAAGSYNHRLVVTSDDAQRPTVTVGMHGEG